MAKKSNNNSNYLDFVPVVNEKYNYKTEDNGNITILIENKGLFNRIAQKTLKKPKISQIHLDELGSFIWKCIDGERTIYDISQLVSAEFGEKAEPLYNRLVQYMKNLESYEFVLIRK
jgi:hypothetical protein